ncbi:hypothetical protein [Spiroplasma mirum]|nr:MULTISPECIES: hypothetical protein [Spiroplasma]
MRVQIYAVYKAIWLNKTPDDPCVQLVRLAGLLKGVTIYPYQNK